MQELDAARQAVLAAVPEADIKVRWLEPMRVTVSIVDWQTADGALLSLPDDDVTKWRDMPKRKVFSAPQRELFRKYPDKRATSVAAIESGCIDAVA